MTSQSEHLWQENQRLERQVRERDEEISRLKSELADWSLALQSLTPGGSEFQSSEVCLSCVRVRLARSHERAKEIVRLGREIARLRGELSRAAEGEGRSRAALQKLCSALVDEVTEGVYVCEICGDSIEVHRWDCPVGVAKKSLFTSPLSDAVHEVLEAARLTANAVRELDKGDEPTRWAFELAACQGMLLKANDRYRALLEGRSLEEVQHEQRESEIHDELIGGRD